MSNHRPLERCARCDDPTGRAGYGEDSIFCESCELGPLCDECVSNDHHTFDGLCPECLDEKTGALNVW